MSFNFKAAVTQNQLPNQFNPNAFSRNRTYQSGQPTNNGQNYGNTRTASNNNQSHQQIRDKQVGSSHNLPSQHSNQTIQTAVPQNTSNQLLSQSTQPQAQSQSSQSQQITIHQSIPSSQHSTQSLATSQQQLSHTQANQPQQQSSDQSNTQQSSHGSNLNRTFPQLQRPVNTHNSDFSFHGTKYEVKCSQTFAYYDAYVIDYDQIEQKLIVAFEWKPIQHVSPSDVRPCLHESAYANWIPREGEKVECKAKAEEHEPFGWWPCYIQTVKDNFFLIKFEGWENSHSEILMRDMLRPYNTQSPIESKGLSRLEIPIPDDMYDWVMTSPKEIRYAGQKAGLIHLGLLIKSTNLVAVGTISQIQKAKKLVEFLWDLQRNFASIEKRDQQRETLFKDIYETLNNCYKLTFKFDIGLTSFVIGKHGVNVHRAKSIVGVRHINIHEGECTILADDEEAAQDAKEVLEINMIKYDIPANLVPLIIGNNGENIKSLEHRSKVFLISTWRRYCQTGRIPYEEPENSDVATMVIIGPKNNLDTALSLLKREIQFVTTKQQIVDRERNASRQFRDFDRPSRGRGRGRGRGDGERTERDNQQGASELPQKSTENNNQQTSNNQFDENYYHEDEYGQNYNDEQYEENDGYEQDYNKRYNEYENSKYDKYDNDEYNYDESQNYNNDDSLEYNNDHSGNISRRRQNQQENFRYVPKPKPQT